MVRTATEVAPRTAQQASVNRAKTQFTAGWSTTLAVPVTKNPNVGVALLPIVVTALPVGGDIQAPGVELVWQTMIGTGRFAGPVSPVTVIEARAPD